MLTRTRINQEEGEDISTVKVSGKTERKARWIRNLEEEIQK
jgi:hypothetical protein